MSAAITVLAHGLGGRSDLPVNAGAAALATAGVVAVSFAVTAFARSSRPELRERITYPVPGAVTRAVDSGVTTALLRVTVLLLTLLVVAIAAFGPSASRFNLAPYVVYVVFWVGLVPLSLLLGPVWRRVNPLRTVHALICRVARRDPRAAMRPLPARIGVWPAAAFLLGFVWLELVYPDRESPTIVLVFLLGYGGVHLALAMVFGARWFAAADGFEVYNRVLGALALLGRDENGRLRLRSPLAGLTELPPIPGLTAVTAVLLGSTAFDGLTRTRWWRTTVPPDSVALATGALVGLVLVVAALFLVAVMAGQALAGTEPGDGPAAENLAVSLIPVALGYTVAHYFSFLLFQGQVALALVSDPLGRGWDLFGTADNTVQSEVVGVGTIGAVQLYAIVGGHLLGVLAAHDRAATVWGAGHLRRAQIPLAAVMVAITLCGVLLLMST